MAKMSALDEALNNIAKQYGEDVVETGVEKNDYDRIPFSSPRLNYMSFGGLPLGHLHEFSGPEGSGKTTTAFDIIKKLLKEDCIISDLLPILNRYDNWEDYDCACDYYDENPILESKEEFDLLREVLR